MNNETMATVPYAAYESAQARADKINKRWFIVVIVLIAALIGTNLGWLIYESQFEVVEETVEETYTYDVDQIADDGDNNFIGHDGEINYGEAED